MLKVYLDRGARAIGKPKDGRAVVSVAAAAFWSFHYDQFLHVWTPFLQRWGASAFHATDFYAGYAEFRRDTDVAKALFDEDCRRLPDLVAPYVTQLFVASLHRDEYERVAPENWRQQYGDANGLAAQMITHSIGHWAQRTGFTGDIQYFYEDGDGEDEAAFAKGLRSVFKNAETRAHARMPATPMPIPKGRARGLEVADYLSWHWNKFDAESRSHAVRKPRKDTDALIKAIRIKGDKIDVRLFEGNALVGLLLAHGCTINESKA